MPLGGHEVLYISNEYFFKNGELVKGGFCDYVLPDGVRLIRLPYVFVGNHFVSDKFRKVKGLYRLLVDFAPDVILSHDLGYWSVLDVISYKKAHPEVKLYAGYPRGLLHLRNQLAVAACAAPDLLSASGAESSAVSREISLHFRRVSPVQYRELRRAGIADGVLSSGRYDSQSGGV